MLRRGVPIDRRILADVAGADRIPEEFLTEDIVDAPLDAPHDR